MNSIEEVKLKKIKIEENEIYSTFQIDSSTSKLKVKYDDINLKQLKDKYNNSINQIVVQMIAFAGIKFCSLLPKEYNLVNYSEYLSEDFIDFFNENYNKIFAQHRYLNDRPNYQGPEVIINQDKLGEKTEILKIKEENKEVLFGCGGGKDSLVSMRLLEKANQPYSAFHYSHSIYGDTKKQKDLINNLTDITNENNYYTFEILEDFLEEGKNNELLKKSEAETMCDAETPKSLFQVLPIMLENNYEYISLGHEKSADKGNFYWDEEEIMVNHQWGKSLEAEKLYRNYIKNNLVEDIQFFSILKPIYDYTIFKLLKDEKEHIKRTHSCNIEKPWCKRCPKCAYVWLNLMAYFDKQVINEMFNENLLKVPELKDTFLKLIGLKDHKPFECVGEVEEAQLAMFYCYQKGVRGEAMKIFNEKLIGNIDFEQLEEKYSKVDEARNFIPDFLKSEILGQFDKVN